MSQKAIALAFVLINYGGLTLQGQQQSTTDLWDISQGVTIITNSPVCDFFGDPTKPFDPRDAFGGTFNSFDPWNAGVFIFADGMGPGFVHFVEWMTPAPITVRSFNLWANGDLTMGREFASFTLKAKTIGATNFNVTLHSFTPTHPYTYVSGVWGLVVSTDVRPVLAQQFRAEFVEWDRGGGPRVLELDGFDHFIGPRTSIRTSQVEISWPSVTNLLYQVEYCSAPTGQWTALCAPIIGTGTTNYVAVEVSSQEQRFFRVRTVQ